MNLELNLKFIKDARKAKALTQDEVAEKMGWKSRTPYAKRENGFAQFTAIELVKLAEILGYNVNELGLFFT